MERLPGLQLGLNGYAFTQWPDDSQDGARVGDGNRGRVFAVGPQIRYDIGQGGLLAKWQHEAGAQNRPAGNRIWFQFSFPPQRAPQQRRHPSNTCKRTPSMSATTGEWDTRYEFKAVLLLCLGFGLVGLDRFMILPMFPTLMKELSLTYQNLGHITGILAVAWGISGFLMGRLSDRIGRRKFVVAAMVAFSVLVGISGLAGGIVSLLVIRAMMGLADGAYTPPSIVATLEASKPSRHGLNLGIQQMAAPLFELGIAPIFVTQMLQVVDWRAIFALVAPPGLIVSYLLYRTLRTPSAQAAAVHTATHDAADHAWVDVFQYRNVWLNMVGCYAG